MKKIHQINRFEGGLNNNSDPRDIENNELAAAQNTDVGTIGQLKVGKTIYSNSSLRRYQGNNDYPDDTTNFVATDWGTQLFSFRHDYQGADGDASTTESATDYLLSSNPSDGTIKILQDDGQSGSAWEDLTTTTDSGETLNGNAFHDFYIANGTVRVHDGNLENKTAVGRVSQALPKWIGYHRNSHFYWNGSGLNSSYNNYEWAIKDAEIKSPASYHAKQSSDPVGHNRMDIIDVQASATSSFINAINDGAGSPSRTTGDIAVTLGRHSSGAETGAANLWTGNWRIAVSFVYDESQESLLHYLKDSGDVDYLTIPADEKIRIETRINANSADKLDGRITGIKVYMKKDGGSTATVTDEPGMDAWYLQSIISLADGVLEDTAGTITKWDHEGTGGSVAAGDTMVCMTGYKLFPNLVSTYESEALHLGVNPSTGQDFGSLTVQWGCSVVANNMAFVGNCRILRSHGGYIVERDSVYKSFPGRYDTFTEHRRLRSAINDGETITALAEYADRLLIFKEHTLHIINIADPNQDILESKHLSRGVPWKHSVANVDGGIMWINYTGIYFYDGKNVIDMFTKQGKRVISRSWFNGWMGLRHGSTKSYPFIGYSQDNRHAVVVNDGSAVTGSGTRNQQRYMVFDFSIGAWTSGSDIVVEYADHYLNASKAISHFCVTGASDLLLKQGQADGSGVEFHTYNNHNSATCTAGTFNVALKETDLGQAARRKKIYKVVASVFGSETTSAAPGLFCKITQKNAYGGGGEGELSNYCYLGDLNGEGNTAGTHDFVTKEFEVPSTDVENQTINFNNVYTIQLFIKSYISSTATSFTRAVDDNWALNDISIIFREKGVI